MTEMKKMKNNDEKLKQTFEAIQKSSESIRQTFENIKKSMPKFTIPEFHFDIPDISKIESPEVIKERNNWERHEELMSIQDTVLKIQDGILNEQKSTSKMTLYILILTIISGCISVLALLKAFSYFSGGNPC